MRKKRITRLIGTAVAAFAALVLLLIGSLYYADHWRIRNVDASTSPDGGYRVLFQSIGKSEQSFGASPARLALRKGRKTVAAHRFDVSNDGVPLHPSNWRAEWQEDRVRVLVTGDAAKHDILCTIHFDGTVETRELETRWASFAELDTTARTSGKTIPDYTSLVFENENGVSAFALTPDQFVTHYNDFWLLGHAQPYLTAPDTDGWIRWPEPSPRFGFASELYWYSQVRTIRSLPTVSVYASENGDSLYEIRMTFDDHGFRENLYQEYKDLCVCLIRTACPAQTESGACRLFDALYSAADRNFFGDHMSFGDPYRPELTELFRLDRIGFYSFYGSGNIEICMIPLTETGLCTLQAGGTEILAWEP